ARGIDGLEFGQPPLEIALLLLHMSERTIAPVVVVAVVANRGCKFWTFPEFVLPLVSEQLLQLRLPVAKVRRRRHQGQGHEKNANSYEPDSRSHVTLQEEF